jgi:very-short-patch-repair endonuclease
MTDFAIIDPGWVFSHKMKRHIIPYNEHLKPLAKKLRQKMTFSEVKLWNEIKNKKLLGYDFDRQRPIGNYIVDFFCKDLQLAIEVDGITHEESAVAKRDAVRQQELEALGISFIRFDAMLVINNVEAVVRDIVNLIEDYEQKHGVPESVKRRRKQG